MRIAVLLLLLASPSLAAEYSLELKPETTKILWTLGDVLHTVHGTFALKQGKIDFNTETGKASGLIVVDTVSGGSGSDARDKRMHAKVLESVKFPEATFTPDRVDGALAIPGASKVKLHGLFNIHGAAHELTMDVEAKSTVEQTAATITFDVPYVAWGMKDPSTFVLKVNKVVQVSIESSGPIVKH